MSKHDDYLDPDKHLYPPDPPVDMDYCMPSHYEQIKKFMKTFEQDTPDSPCMPSLAVRKLRAKTILEEALERINALGFGVINEIGEEIANTGDIELEELYEFNPKEFLDGVCDAEYFDIGSLIALGISETAYINHFNKVHEANMGKLWTENEIKKCGGILLPLKATTIGSSRQIEYNNKFYSAKRINENQWLVRDKDGKVIKPPSFKAPETEII